jgi:hypothetical protein
MPSKAGVALLAVTLLPIACGDPGPARSGGDAAPAPAASDGEDLVEGTGMVIETGRFGPELCLSTVAESYPPQCRGIPLEGWSWDDVAGEETAAGTTWGDYHVVGSYDGHAFTIAEASAPQERERPEDEEQDRFTPPCPEPPGGWRAPDPERATHDQMGDAAIAAQEEPDFAAIWVGYPYKDPTETNPENMGPNDIVLNVAFTGDIERHERELREIWGGPLCVVERGQRYRDLRSVQRELGEVAESDFGLQVLWSDIDEIGGAVLLSVVTIDEATKAELDRRYGEGVVEVTAQLRPVE